MPVPVTDDDIVSGAVAFLYSKPDVLAVLGSDPDGPWLFQYELWAKDLIEGSESTALVISSDGGWAGPNLQNTLRFPRLQIDVYADPIRDHGNNVIDPGEVQRRAYRAFQVVDKYLHRVNSETQMWGTIRTVSCSRLTEPVVYRVPDGDGLLRCQVYYAVAQG